MEPIATTLEALVGPLNAYEQKFAPKELWAVGDTAFLSAGPRVSVVGSRAASDAGIMRARQLCKLLVGEGIAVISGLAEGIDTVAHRSTIDSGGRTIGVLGTPLNRSYPPSNRELQQLMMREHLVITCFAPMTRTQPWHFPLRNRLMALLADATVIVEAGESSGTLSQGWESLRLGRPLFLLESVATAPELKWPAEMMRYGAKVLSKSSVGDLLDELPARCGGDSDSAILF